MNLKLEFKMHLSSLVAIYIVIVMLPLKVISFIFYGRSVKGLANDGEYLFTVFDLASTIVDLQDNLADHHESIRNSSECAKKD